MEKQKEFRRENYYPDWMIQRRKPRNERITSRTRRAKSTFFTRSGCSSVLIPTREKKRRPSSLVPSRPYGLAARNVSGAVRQQTLDNLRRGVILPAPARIK